MDRPIERAPDSVVAPDLDDMLAAFSPLDPQETLDLHRAINERRASVENAEMLRRLRSL
jgi:hypothetical protein